MTQELGVHDFDLHGVVGVRLLDATPEDVAKVTRQLGPIHGSLSAEPDIRIRFVDRLRSCALTYVDVGGTGFAGEDFFVLRGPGGVTGRALLPFDDVGGVLEIVCERRMPVVPHLLACINMAALAKGVLPLHASAFESDGRGVLVMGWAKGGKTEALLDHMNRGASYIGDEWVYLTPDGEMFGLPEPIRLWGWHLSQLPHVYARRGRNERLKLASWQGAASAVRVAGGRSSASSIARRAHSVLQRQAYLRIPPEELFGREHMVLRGRVDAVLLLLSHESDHIAVEQAGPREISGRMAASLVQEREPFLTHYRQFRFAFPDRRSAVVETAAERERALLQALFDGREACKITHPYPCDLPVLGDAVAGAASDDKPPMPAAAS